MKVPQSNRLDVLAGFIRFLKTHGVVRGVNNIRDRLRIHRCAYIARLFDLDLQYNFNRYVYGPYSDMLNLEIMMLKNGTHTGEIHPERYDFQADDFAQFMKDLNPNNLEIASTLIFLDQARWKGRDLIDKTLEVSGMDDEGSVIKVMEILQRYSLIS